MSTIPPEWYYFWYNFLTSVCVGGYVRGDISHGPPHYLAFTLLVEETMWTTNCANQQILPFYTIR